MKKIISLKKGFGDLEWYLLIAIPLIGTLIFNVVPLFQTIVNSMSNSQSQFIGFTNYGITFKDYEFKQSVFNTLYMGILGVFLNIPIAFTLANMLNNIPKGKNVYKVFFLLPLITSIVTVAILFKFIFSPDKASIANYVISLIGMQPLGWFNDVNMSRETLVMMALWKGIGYNVILFFAGLQTVPTELYEAATIDGANERQKWRYITIPCMRNTFIFVYITSCIAVLKRFADVYAVSSEYGNPGGTLFTIILYIYRKSFSTLFYKDLGVASAASVVLFILILVITAINYFLTERDDSVTHKRKNFSRQDNKKLLDGGGNYGKQA